MARVQAARPIEAEPIQSEFEHAEFVTSGSTLLDLVLGGGWARGRVVNVVGDKSAGKTLLAIEATANFARVTDPQRIRYAEAEAAFDTSYAESMGMPPGIQLKEGLETVEQLDADMGEFLESLAKTKKPAFYALDSLDALSDDAEMKEEMGKATYGTSKAKKMSEFFRRKVRLMQEADVTMYVVSQIRDKIGVTFGETKTRSGGRALDFYCSQILWLSEIEKITRESSGIKRVVGLTILAKNKKNKVGPAWREAEIDLIFNYGIDDEASMIKWLKKAKADFAPHTDAQWKLMVQDARRRHDRAARDQLQARLRSMTIEHWMNIEAALQPPCSKYGE